MRATATFTIPSSRNKSRRWFRRRRRACSITVAAKRCTPIASPPPRASCLLCEGAPRVRAGIAARFAGNAKIRAVAPEEVEPVADHSLDLIVLHSVAQYLTPEELAKLLALFHRLLNADGVLVVSDIIPPDVAASTDALALLRFGAANGFFVGAVTGLVRTVLSDYWRLRTRYGLTRYGEAAMTEKLAAAGFFAQRAPRNIGHNQARMAFMARPR